MLSCSNRQLIKSQPLVILRPKQFLTSSEPATNTGIREDQKFQLEAKYGSISKIHQLHQVIKDFKQVCFCITHRIFENHVSVCKLGDIFIKAPTNYGNHFSNITQTVFDGPHKLIYILEVKQLSLCSPSIILLRPLSCTSVLSIMHRITQQH